MAMAAVGIAGGALALLLPQKGGRRGGGCTVSFRRAAASVVVRASYEAGVGVMATKVGMMTYFDPETGKPVPVTVVGFRDGGNVVTQVKTAATDGYDAVQVGYHGVREDKLTRPELGHLGKAGAPPLKHLQEFRLTAVDAFEPGQELDFAELFKEGDLVDVSGNSIGKGFQGTVISLTPPIANANDYRNPHFCKLFKPPALSFHFLNNEVRNIKRSCCNSLVFQLHC
jgi:large subunit ribosomal protein L3